MLMEGIFAAVTTPFYTDEKVYYRKVEANMARYSRSLLAGMLVLGSTGEAALLDDAESAEVLRCAAGAARPEKVLIAGIGRESVKATLALAEVAAESGYDAVLVRAPSYYRSQMTPGVVANYFRTVADRSPLPVLLYNVPQYAGIDLGVETVAELASHENIIGIKDSMGSVERIRELVKATAGARKRTVAVTPVFEAVTGRMLVAGAQGDLVQVSSAGGGTAVATAPAGTGVKTRMKEVGFQVLCGSGSVALEALEAGASGAILAFAACAPGASTEFYMAWKDHDLELAREKQKRIAGPNKRIVVELGIAGLKYACDFNGYYGGRARLPLVGMTAEQRAEVEVLLANIRN
jgi:dihydrodipicolinate synthase/N-acetylneuraminate lyase